MARVMQESADGGEQIAVKLGDSDINLVADGCLDPVTMTISCYENVTRTY